MIYFGLFFQSKLEPASADSSENSSSTQQLSASAHGVTTSASKKAQQSLHGTYKVVKNRYTPLTFCFCFQSGLGDMRPAQSLTTPRVIGSKIVVGADGRQRRIPIIEQMPAAPLREQDVSRMWANNDVRMRSFYSEPTSVTPLATLS